MHTVSTSNFILVVDDNCDAADLLAELLSLHGFETAVAYGGVEAIEAVAQRTPTAILLDLGMPEMDGYQVAMLLRKSTQYDECNLIAYSAWDDAGTLLRVKSAGFDLHLAKPAPFEKIVEAVSTGGRQKESA